MNFLRNMWQDDEGQDLVEYALIVVLISVALVASLTALKTSINGVFTAIETALGAA